MLAADAVILNVKQADRETKGTKLEIIAAYIRLLIQGTPKHRCTAIKYLKLFAPSGIFFLHLYWSIFMGGKRKVEGKSEISIDP